MSTFMFRIVAFYVVGDIELRAPVVIGAVSVEQGSSLCNMWRSDQNNLESVQAYSSAKDPPRVEFRSLGKINVHASSTTIVFDFPSGIFFVFLCEIDPPGKIRVNGRETYFH